MVETTDVVGKADDSQVLAEAQKRFAMVAEAEQDWRRECLESWRFYLGEQWPDSVVAAREKDGRPCLTINDLPNHVRQTVNAISKNPPSVRVSAVEDSDVQTAEVLQGLVRQIEQSSNAKIAYKTAMEHLAVMGFGHWRVIAEYAGADGRQCVKIKPILDPFSVYIDPAAQEPDLSDAQFFFVRGKMSKESFRARYGEEGSPESALAFSGEGETWKEPEGIVPVVEYWRAVETPSYSGVLSNGERFKNKQYPSDVVAEMQKSGASVYERPHRSVEQFVVTNNRVLKRAKWPGELLPIIRVIARDYWIDGKRIVRGMIHDAKDPARMYNYMVSAAVEAIALAPKAPWVVADGQLEGYEQEWTDANKRNFAYLTYNPKSLNGDLLPPPQRNVVEPPIQAMAVMIGQFDKDKKGVTAVNGPALGEPSAERSGRAILARQRESDEANQHYAEALAAGVAATGRILLEQIQARYDTERIERIILPNGQQKQVQLMPGAPPAKNPGGGFDRVFDVTVGQYDVVVSTGPSYETKRQQASDQMIELAKVVPALPGAAPDLLIKELDIPGADELAKRMQKTLPPALQDAPEGQPQIPPQVQQQMAQMQQQIQVMTGIINDQAAKIEGNVVESESRERIEQAKLASAERIAKLEANVDLTIAAMRAEIDEMKAERAAFAATQRAANQPQKETSQNGRN